MSEGLVCSRLSLSPATARPVIAGTPTRKHAALARYWLKVPSPKGDVAVTAMTTSSKRMASVFFLMSSMFYLPSRGTLSIFANGTGFRDCCPGQSGFRSDGLTGFGVKAKTPAGIPPCRWRSRGERRVFGGEGEIREGLSFPYSRFPVTQSSLSGMERRSFLAFLPDSE